MMTSIYCTITRRRWKYYMIFLVILGFISLSFVLYMCIVLLYDHQQDFPFVGRLNTRLRDDILLLDGVEEVLFQGEFSETCTKTMMKTVVSV